MSAQPYRPFIALKRESLHQASIAAFWDGLGITQELLEERGGYVWAFYQHGKRLPGGINDLPALCTKQ